jgi:hypothetical protein
MIKLVVTTRSTMMDLMVVMEVVAVNHHPMVIVDHDRVDVAVGTVVPRDC